VKVQDANSQTSGGKRDEKDFRATFECLGVVTGEVIGDNTRCDCPFCGKEHHFYINVRTGQWDCKVCGKSGNHFNFLKAVVDHMEDYTLAHPQKWDALAEDRRIPADAFREDPVAWNYLTSEWIFPAYSEKGTVRDVRRWSGRGVMSTEGCKVQLFGLYTLAKDEHRRKRRVWICEGEWDGMALRWLLRACGSNDLVLAVPGANTFKQEWVAFFKDCDLVFVYDNDDTGDKGSAKASRMLSQVTRRQRFVCWPETRKQGYDTRDHVGDGLAEGLEPLAILASLETLIRDEHRRALTGDATKPSTLAREVGPPCSFTELVDVFKKWVKLDRDFVDALAISLAVPLSNSLPGEPLWFYIIGVPGGGKTLILGSLSQSPMCSFHSTFTAKSLVSGYNRDPDPSLLPQLNGLTAVFKDGTELLAMHPDERREAYSTLRGAYDGRVDKPFGNGVMRKYTDLHFNMLIGVTPAIRGDSQATMGERFLSIEMKENLASLTDKLYQCVTNTSREVQMNEALCEACARFLNREVDPDRLPKIPEPHVHRIVAMAQLIALLRATVERDPRDRDWKFRATSETGTRVVKQLAKLAMVLALALGKAEVDLDVCRILRKVMADTSIGFHVDVVKALVRNDNRPMTAGEIGTLSQINYVTLGKRLEDMTALRILDTHYEESQGRGDMPRTKYLLSDRLWSLWQQSQDGVRRGH
jgi:hypothetical protein